MEHRVYLSLILSTVSDLLAFYVILSTQIDLFVIYAYLFITKYAFWSGEFFKGLATLLSSSKKPLTILLGMGLVAIVLVQLMNLSGFYLWYLATGTDFMISSAWNKVLSSQLFIATIISFLSVLISFIIYLAKKDYKNKLGAISLINSIFYPIVVVFMILILGLGLIIFKDSRLAIAILFLVLVIVDKAIIVFESGFAKEKQVPSFVTRLSKRL